jgi:hypothetical protein
MAAPCQWIQIPVMEWIDPDDLIKTSSSLDHPCARLRRRRRIVISLGWAKGSTTSHLNMQLATFASEGRRKCKFIV